MEGSGESLCERAHFLAKHGVLIDIDAAEYLDCSLVLLGRHDGGLVDSVASGTTAMRGDGTMGNRTLDGGVIQYLA